MEKELSSSLRHVAQLPGFVLSPLQLGIFSYKSWL